MSVLVLKLFLGSSILHMLREWVTIAHSVNTCLTHQTSQDFDQYAQVLGGCIDI
jgi:hypothetical protein